MAMSVEWAWLSLYTYVYSYASGEGITAIIKLQWGISMANNKKALTRIIDIETGEELVSAD